MFIIVLKTNGILNNIKHIINLLKKHVKILIFSIKLLTALIVTKTL